MTKINFKNQPTLSPHEVDKTFNERRINLIPAIQDFISNHELFKNGEVSITFLTGGVSSLVTILETKERKVILKIPLSKTFSQGEGLFLKVWEKAGVKVPRIVDEGILNEHSYVMYDYVEAKTLGGNYSLEELIQRKVYFEMGEILRKMHVPKSNGYGQVRGGRAEYSAFIDWINSPELESKIGYVKENKLLGEDHGSLVDAFKTLTDLAHKENESSYCHEDFHIYNIFDTKPLTVFDPNPRFNHGYIDIARTIFGTVWNGEPEEVRIQLIDGYFKGESYNIKALHSAVLLYSYMKLPYSHKTNKIENIKNVQDYLLKNRYLMD